MGLDLRQTIAVAGLLRVWAEELERGKETGEEGRVPSVQMMQVSWRNTEETVSFGGLEMPGGEEGVVVL